MSTIAEYNLFIASWEHLYLLPDGIPAGLPNQLFSRHPWALILFENLYCDENGLKGEQNAAEQMNWTNSELFVKLASRKYDIIKPINLKTPLHAYIDDVKNNFRKKHKLGVEEAIKKESVSVENLFDWRLQLLKGFLDEHKLILYDWPIAREGSSIPISVQMAATDVLGLEVRAVPLSRDVSSELSPHRKEIFDSLQQFEEKPLQHLRSGRLSQTDYLEFLKKRIHDYREVDMELGKNIDTNFERIIKLRERFGARGGWELLRTYLKEYDRAAHPKELIELDEELRDRLKMCFKPTLKDYGPATWKIAKGIVSLSPYGGVAKELLEMKKPIKEIGGLLSESFKFFRGDIRKGKK